MREPDEVLATAASRYWRTWRDALLATSDTSHSFPLKPPTTATVLTRPGDVGQWLSRWRQWATKYPSVQLRTKTLHTKHGNQPVYTHLDVPDTPTLAYLNPETREHWTRARARWAQLAGTTPTAAARPWLTQLTDLDDPDFNTVLAAAHWFRKNPSSGLTIRQVPVPGMHTKWLAHHRRLVLAALGTSANTSEPSDDDDPEDLPLHELDALGLRPPPRELDLLLTDPAHRAHVAGIRQMRAPVDEVARLPIEPRTLLLIENKEAAFAINDTPGLVVIHSLGNHLNILTEIPWIPHDHSYYWGDLDRHGFTLLSRARQTLPKLQSMLMSPEALDEYKHLAVHENLDRFDEPGSNLTLTERSALNTLHTGSAYLRIEQERIPSCDVNQVVVNQLSPAHLEFGSSEVGAPGSSSTYPSRSS